MTIGQGLAESHYGPVVIAPRNPRGRAREVWHGSVWWIEGGRHLVAETGKPTERSITQQHRRLMSKLVSLRDNHPDMPLAEWLEFAKRTVTDPPKPPSHTVQRSKAAG
jgi:hypothetical protein